MPPVLGPATALLGAADQQAHHLGACLPPARQVQRRGAAGARGRQPGDAQHVLHQRQQQERRALHTVSAKGSLEIAGRMAPAVSGRSWGQGVAVLMA